MKRDLITPPIAGIIASLMVACDQPSQSSDYHEPDSQTPTEVTSGGEASNRSRAPSEILESPLRLESMLSIDSATLVRGRRGDATLDLKPIRKQMAAAEWLPGEPINKGTYELRVEGFPDIHVSEINGCFWIDGQEGLYKVREEDIGEFDRYLWMARSATGEQVESPDAE